jgi:hypothetical protein
MAEDITNPNAGNPNQFSDGFKSVTNKLADNDKTLGKIAESSNDTGEKIGDLLKRQREGNDLLKDASSNLDEIAKLNKKMVEDSAEQKREGKVGGRAGAKELETAKKDAELKEVKEKKSLADSLKDFNKSLGGSLDSFFKFKDKFLSPKGWNALWKDSLKTLRTGFGNIFAESTGLLFGTLSTALPKLIGNFEMIFKPITFVLSKMGVELEGVGSFFGKIANFFNETGPFMNKTLGFIEKLFGPEAGTIFLEAFQVGAKIGEVIPFLAVIPTAIETVVAAFEMLSKGDFKGAFKALITGTLKGVAAFFTFGLSDLIFDFDKMFKALSEPLDALFSVFKDFFMGFKYIFDSIMVMVNGLWNDFLEASS